MVRRPSVRRPPSSTLSNLNISEASWPILIKILWVASLGWGERLHTALGADWIKTPISMATESPYWLKWGNDVSTFSRLFLIRSFLYMQVTRTCIKSRTNSNFDKIGPLTTELAALERQKNPHRLIMGKWCLHASSFFIESSSKLLVTRTGIKARTSLISGRIRLLTLELLALEWRKFYIFKLEYLWGQLTKHYQVVCVASLGWGKAA